MTCEALWRNGDDEDRATLLASNAVESQDERVLMWLKDKWSVWQQQTTPSYIAKIPKDVLEDAICKFGPL